MIRPNHLPFFAASTSNGALNNSHCSCAHDPRHDSCPGEPTLTFSAIRSSRAGALNSLTLPILSHRGSSVTQQLHDNLLPTKTTPNSGNPISLQPSKLISGCDLRKGSGLDCTRRTLHGALAFFSLISSAHVAALHNLQGIASSNKLWFSTTKATISSFSRRRIALQVPTATPRRNLRLHVKFETPVAPW